MSGDDAATRLRRAAERVQAADALYNEDKPSRNAWEDFVWAAGEYAPALAAAVLTLLDADTKGSPPSFRANMATWAALDAAAALLPDDE